MVVASLPNVVKIVLIQAQHLVQRLCHTSVIYYGAATDQPRVASADPQGCEAEACQARNGAAGRGQAQESLPAIKTKVLDGLRRSLQLQFSPKFQSPPPTKVGSAPVGHSIFQRRECELKAGRGRKTEKHRHLVAFQRIPLHTHAHREPCLLITSPSADSKMDGGGGGASHEHSTPTES